MGKSDSDPDHDSSLGLLEPESMLRRSLAVSRFLASGLGNLVLPPACRFCEGPVCQGQHFCQQCLGDLSVTEAMMQRSCPSCGIPGPGFSSNPGLASSSEPSGLHESGSDAFSDWCASGDPRSDGAEAVSSALECPHCRGAGFDFDGVLPLWMYRDRVCDAIVAAKYVHNTPLADALGQRLGQAIAPRFGEDPPSEVTFVPSHFFRQLSRGGIGNRAIAEAVAKQLQIPVRGRLRTSRQIEKQAWLGDEERKTNVCGAFAPIKSYAFSRSPKLDDRHILVVDDVLTTGATASEVARVLKDTGARRVTIAVVARAIRTM